MTMTPLLRRGAGLAAALLSAALVLTACGSDSDEPSDTAAQTRKVEADNGTVEVPAAPKRIVTIGNTTRPFIDLGGKPVGVTEISASQLGRIPKEQKATYEAATNVGNSGGEVDLEKVASLKPDLILHQGPDSEFKQIENQLKSIAPTAFWGLDTEWKTFADKIAEAGNLTDTLDKQKAEFKNRSTKIQTEYSDIIKNDKFVAVDRSERSDPGTFYIADIGCSEIARDDLGLNFPKAVNGADPLAYESLPFEQIAGLSKYDVITYPVDAEGQPTKPFAPVVETNTWKALPTVTSGHALGVFCPGNNSYGDALLYLDSLDRALANLKAKG